MKVYSVLFESTCGTRQRDLEAGVFPRAFRTREEAVHAIEEDALETWNSLFSGDPELKYPGLQRELRDHDPDLGTYYIEVGGDEDTITYTVVEQEFE